MSAIAYAPLDPLRDARHRTAKASRDLYDWLAYLELGNKAARTLDTYERYGAALLRDWPDVGFDEFGDQHLAHSLKRFPPKSRHIVKAAWNNWFGWGYKTSRRIPGNPVDLLPTIRYRPNRTYDIFTDAERDALCAHSRLMTLMFEGMLRRAECRMMTGKRLDLERAQILVIDGAKGSKARQVPMTAVMARAGAELLTLEGIGPDDYLWARKPGGGKLRRDTPISNTSFDNWWKLSLKAAGVRHRNPHMARHTGATMWRRRGLPMEAIQRLLGHESISTTSDTYVNTEVEQIGDLMRELVGDRA